MVGPIGPLFMILMNTLANCCWMNSVLRALLKLGRSITLLLHFVKGNREIRFCECPDFVGCLCGQFVDGILSTQPLTAGKEWERM